MSNPQFCYIKKPNHSIQRAIGETNHFWETGETITYYFVGGTLDQRNFVRSRIINMMKFVNLKFVQTTTPATSDLRISFQEGQGSWSYIGKVSRLISKNNATMNFGWLKTINPDNTGLVDHELGHMIGAGHEHRFPNWIIWNEQRVIADMAKQGWTEAQTRNNILNAYNEDDIKTTASGDGDSVMLYVFPKEWTLNGVETKFNTTWSQSEIDFWAEVYPHDTPVEPEEPKLVEDSVYLDALTEIYCNEVFKNAAIRLPLYVNRKVAELLGVSSKGLERTITERIKNKLNNVTR